MKAKRLQWLGILCFLLLGIFLRAFRISQWSLWDDEGTSFVLAAVPFKELLYAVKTYYFSPPLWPLICRVFTFFAPDSPWIVRLPSLVAGIAVFPLILRWAHHQKNLTAGVFAVGILALSPIGIFYAQEGRNYLLMSTLYFSGLFSTLRFLDTQKRLFLWLATLTTLANLMLHDIGGALWFGLNLYFLTALYCRQQINNRRLWLPWILAQGILGLLLLAYVPTFLNHLRVLQPVNPYQFFWEKDFWFQGTLTSLRNLVPGDFSPKSRMPLPHLVQGGWILSALAGGLLLNKKIWGNRNSPVLPLLVAALAPLLCIAILSDLITPAYWIGRTEVLVLPVFGLILGFCLAETKPTLLAGGLFLIFIFAGAGSMWEFHTSPLTVHKTWDAKTAAYLLEGTTPDLIILEKETRASVSAHLLPKVKKIKVIPFPSADGFNPENWPSRLLQIQKNQTIHPDTLNQALKSIHEEITQEAIKNVAVVYASQTINQEHFRGTHVNELLRTLQHSGCTYRERPRLLPMDFHSGGVHVVVKMQCTSPT